MKTAERIAAALVLVPDQPSGRIGWDFSPRIGFKPKFRYKMSGEWKHRLREGLKLAAEIYFAAGAEWVAFSSEIFPALTSVDEIGRLDSFPLKPGVTSLISAHVQGTCRMGLEPGTSVVNQDLRLHTHGSVYVVDASVMPTSASHAYHDPDHDDGRPRRPPDARAPGLSPRSAGPKPRSAQPTSSCSASSMALGKCQDRPAQRARQVSKEGSSECPYAAE